MIPRHALLASSLAVLCLTGCGLFSKKDRPKESSAISVENEENFRQRWVQRRSEELVAQGVAAEAAQAQAGNEFRERYPYMRAGRK